MSNGSGTGQNQLAPITVMHQIGKMAIGTSLEGPRRPLIHLLLVTQMMTWANSSGQQLPTRTTLYLNDDPSTANTCG